MRSRPPPPPRASSTAVRVIPDLLQQNQSSSALFFLQSSAVIVIVWNQALCKASTIWLLREDMGDLLRGENDSKWSSEVQAIGDRIFFTDIQRCKNFSSIITYKRYFFSEQEVFSLGISLQDFFSRNQSGIPAASGIRESFAFGIRKTTKLCFERQNPGLWNRNTAQGIWNSPTIGIQNESSTIKESEMRYMESGNYGVESRNQDCCP